MSGKTTSRAAPADFKRRTLREERGVVAQELSSVVAEEIPVPASVPRLHSRRAKQLLMTADAVAALGGVFVAFTLQFLLRPVPQSIVVQELLLSLASVPFFVFGAGLNRMYQARANERSGQELRNILNSVLIGLAGLVTLSFVIQNSALSRLWVVLLACSISTALFINRRVARLVFARMRLSGKMARRIVIVGTDAHAVGLMHTYERNPGLGYRVVGFIGEGDIGERGGVSVLGSIGQIGGILEEHNAVGAVVSLASVRSEDVNMLTRQLTEKGYHVALSSSLRDIDVERLRPQQLDGRTMIYVEPVLRGGWRAVAKRAFDLGLASSILLLSLPVMLIAAVAIRLDSQGPMLFSQTRVGRNGDLFRLSKLRTMVVDAEERKASLAHLNESDGALFKIRNDPRITRVGRALRKFSIAERPQLFSVLRGTMSMVGPRPALPDEVAQWDAGTTERLRVLPGLTGMWQVSGRSDSSFDEYKRLDLYYVDNWSLKHDLEICLKTVRVVLTGSGAV